MGIVEKIFKENQLIEKQLIETLAAKFLEIEGFTFTGESLLESESPRAIKAVTMAIAALEILKITEQT